MDTLEDPRRITVGEFEAMGRAGVFVGDEHLELLDGRIFSLSMQGPRHLLHVARLREHLRRLAGDDHFVLDHSSYPAGPYDMPEPDIAVIIGDRASFVDYPRPEETVLVAEVADSSLARDRYKSRVYAAAGIAEYWIIDVEHRRIEVRRSPDDGGYESLVVLHEHESVDSPFGSVPVAELLPPL